MEKNKTYGTICYILGIVIGIYSLILLYIKYVDPIFLAVNNIFLNNFVIILAIFKFFPLNLITSILLIYMGYKFKSKLNKKFLKIGKIVLISFILFSVGYIINIYYCTIYRYDGLCFIFGLLSSTIGTIILIFGIIWFYYLLLKK